MTPINQYLIQDYLPVDTKPKEDIELLPINSFDVANQKTKPLIVKDLFKQIIQTIHNNPEIKQQILQQIKNEMIKDNLKDNSKDNLKDNFKDNFKDNLNDDKNVNNKQNINFDQNVNEGLNHKQSRNETDIRESHIILMELLENDNQHYINSKIDEIDKIEKEWVWIEKENSPEKSLKGSGSAILPVLLIVLKYTGSITWTTCKVSGKIIYHLIVNASLIGIIALSIFAWKPNASMGVIHRLVR